MTNIGPHLLGRLHAPDPRDAHYPLRALMPEKLPTPRTRFWRTGPVLNQGDTPRCVGFACKGLLMASPVRHKFDEHPSADEIYIEAQKVDEWPGENYDGTSVRGGVKYLTALGRVASYRWAANVDEIISWLSSNGPIVMGTNFYTGMFRPQDTKGYLEPTGQIEGGHAYDLIGWSVERDAARMLNSWDRTWGENGRAWMRRVTIERLLGEDGEACAAVEAK